MPTEGTYSRLQRLQREKEERERAETPTRQTPTPQIATPERHLSEARTPQEPIPTKHLPEMSTQRAPTAGSHPSSPERPATQQTGAPPVPIQQIPARPEPTPDYTAGTEQFTLYDNWILDKWLPNLDSQEQAVYLRLYRLTIGFNRRACTVTHDRLAEKTRLSPQTVRRVCQRLVGRGIIRSWHAIDGPVTMRGLVHELLEPADRLAEILAERDKGREAAPKREPTRRTPAPQRDMKVMKSKNETEGLSDPLKLREARRRELLGRTPDASAAEIEAALDGWE